MAQFLSYVKSLMCFFNPFATSSNGSRGHYLMKYERRISYVVQSDIRSYPTCEWVAELQKPDGFSNWLSKLKSCTVCRVDHYRGHGSIPHEFIVVHIKSLSDERCIWINRYSGQQKPIIVGDPWRSMDLPTDYDEVKVMNNEQLRTVCRNHSFKLVQYVHLKEGVMNVVDCVALLDAITLSSRNYSLCTYMCWWYSAIFFHTIVRTYGVEDQIEKGPLFKVQGCVVYGRIRKSMVGSNCQLILEPDDHYEMTVEKLAKVIGSDTEVVRGNMKNDQEHQKDDDMLTGMVKKYGDHRLRVHEIFQQNFDNVQADIKWRWQMAENERLEAEIGRLEAENRRLEAEIERKENLRVTKLEKTKALLAEIAQAEAKIEEMQRGMRAEERMAGTVQAQM
ncbi:hypothetical protein J3R30DRAFT_3488063 [Lentinula aciculospora]|uniref:Uncharacterized protein n=1 Tax=Lentinula aciculospora TaxID=153920 RepID=A0A9W9DLM8_9AGAR|nr:hypothetical protein J3R30DRAFT_3488063 [Lentinula aciculospora]